MDTDGIKEALAARAHGRHSSYDSVREVLPNEIVVAVEESPEDYVESVASNVAACLSQMSEGEANTISDYNQRLANMLIGKIADEHVDLIKMIIGDEREHQIIFAWLASQYDQAGVGGDAVDELEDLLRSSRSGSNSLRAEVERDRRERGEE